MSSISEKLEKQRRQRKLEQEIQRLDNEKSRLLKIDEPDRTEDERRFLAGVDESIERYSRELMLGE